MRYLLQRHPGCRYVLKKAMLTNYKYPNSVFFSPGTSLVSRLSFWSEVLFGYEWWAMFIYINSSQRKVYATHIASENVLLFDCAALAN
jgi:hypothetical protein